MIMKREVKRWTILILIFTLWGICGDAQTLDRNKVSDILKSITPLLDNGMYYRLDSKTKTAGVTSGHKVETRYKGIVKIPETINFLGDTYKVTRIENSAFNNCYELTEVQIPQSIISISVMGFRWSSVSRIVVDKRNPIYDSRNNCNAIILKSKNMLIVGCKNTVIPNTVTAIGDSAFISTGSTIKIPESIKFIGREAFSDCRDLTSITLPEGIKEIRDYTFSYCFSLISIVFPKSLEKIGIGAFHGCSKLKSIELPSGLKAIGDGAFDGCKSISSIWIPDGVTNLKNVFGNCSSLKDIHLPKALKYINRTFRHLKLLSTIEIPNGVKSIERNSFIECPSLDSITIPRSVEIIRYGAFFECRALKTVRVYPQTVIEEKAFLNCPKVKIEVINTGEKTKTPDIKSMTGSRGRFY